MKIKLLLIGIIILGCFLRFYKLGSIPDGLYQDETAIGWNAYSILQTGNDEYGQHLPLYFKSFGDYKLPVYIYLTAVSVHFFGLTPFAVRLPSALFGVLTLPVIYLLIQNITNKKNIAILATFLLAINPWHLHYTRATFEVSIVLFLFCTGLLFLQLSINRKKGAFIAGIICFILALYTYNLTRLLAPMVVAGWLILYRQKIKHISQLEKMFAIGISILMLIPFILTYFKQGGVSSAAGTLIFSSAAVKAPLLEFRSYFVHMPVVNKILFNSITLIFWQYIVNILNYLSVPFFFLTGSPHGNHGISTDGQFYIFELPCVMYGIYLAIKRREKELYPLFLVAISTIFSAALTREAPHATRSFTLLMFIPFISAYGLIHLYKKLQNISYPVRGAIIFLCIAGSFFSVSHYFLSYYVRFPIAYAKSWRQQDKNVAEYIHTVYDQYDNILIDIDAGYIYSSLLFYNSISPKTFQETVRRAPDDTEGMSTVLSFDKVIYAKFNPQDKSIPPRTIIITTPEKVSSMNTQKTFVYPPRPIVVSLKQEIFQYPTQDTAYVAITSTNH